jgi:hypothetical protein
MANPLFYNKVVPLNRETHRKLKLKPLSNPLDYARGAHLIPAIVDEFSVAAAEIPIAFLPGAAVPAVVFVVGLRPGTNGFITPDGRWQGSYVPAYLRRYPFIIGDVPNAEPVLCFDESFEGFGEREGKRLFSTGGEPQPPVTEALKLANDYRAAAIRTDAFAKSLQSLGLFRSVSLDARHPDGQSTVVHGLLVVDEAALNALKDEDFLELRRNGFLKSIYAHLASLGAVSKLADKLAPSTSAT